MRRLTLLLLLPISLAACDDGVGPASAESVGQPEIGARDLATSAASSAQSIPGQYIVVFRDAVGDPSGLARRLAAQHGGSVRFTYQHALKGFSAELPEAAVEALGRNPNVAFIEPNGRVWAVGSQTNPPWGLDRIDQRDGLDNTYSHGFDGTGVAAYILDTGIRISHTDFGGRAAYGYDAVDNDPDAGDCNGHGTHVAGTVGGGTYGVAKNVQLFAVRVLDCNGSGTWEGVIAGIDWVTGHHTNGPAVANMSLSGGANSAVDQAVQNSIADGVFYALAAGNGNFVGRPQDACSSSPARTPEAATVGATDSGDNEASFSNYGTCVDILAPGVGVTSAWIDSDSDVNTISGTSMAAPHVAGAAVLYLDANPDADPATVVGALTSNATANAIALHRSSRRNHTPNLLLYTGFIGDGGGGGDPGNNPPTADFTFTTSDLRADFTDASSDPDVSGSIVAWDWDFGDGTGTSTVQDPSYTYGSGGTYNVTLAVTDNDGATDEIAKSVTVSTSGGATGTHVSDLDGAGVNNGKIWDAIVTVRVHDASEAALDGATVSGSWSGFGGGTVIRGSCTTGSTGSGACTVRVNGMRKNNGPVTFTVTGVDSGDYTASDNHDPDGDSDGTTIVVSKP